MPEIKQSFFNRVLNSFKRIFSTRIENTTTLTNFSNNLADQQPSETEHKTSGLTAAEAIRLKSSSTSETRFKTEDEWRDAIQNQLKIISQSTRIKNYDRTLSAVCIKDGRELLARIDQWQTIGFQNDYELLKLQINFLQRATLLDGVALQQYHGRKEYSVNDHKFRKNIEDLQYYLKAMAHYTNRKMKNKYADLAIQPFPHSINDKFIISNPNEQDISILRYKMLLVAQTCVESIIAFARIAPTNLANGTVKDPAEASITELKALLSDINQANARIYKLAENQAKGMTEIQEFKDLNNASNTYLYKLIEEKNKLLKLIPQGSFKEIIFNQDTGEIDGTPSRDLESLDPDDTITNNMFKTAESEPPKSTQQRPS